MYIVVLNFTRSNFNRLNNFIVLSLVLILLCIMFSAKFHSYTEHFLRNSYPSDRSDLCKEGTGFNASLMTTTQINPSYYFPVFDKNINQKLTAFRMNQTTFSRGNTLR